MPEISDVIIAAIVGSIFGSTIAFVGSMIHVKALKKTEEETKPRAKFRELFYPYKVRATADVHQALIQTQLDILEFQAMGGEESWNKAFLTLGELNNSMMRNMIFIDESVGEKTMRYVMDGMLELGKEYTEGHDFSHIIKKSDLNVRFTEFIDAARKSLGTDSLSTDLATFFERIEGPPEKKQ